MPVAALGVLLGGAAITAGLIATNPTRDNENSNSISTGLSTSPTSSTAPSALSSSPTSSSTPTANISATDTNQAAADSLQKRQALAQQEQYSLFNLNSGAGSSKTNTLNTSLFGS